MTTTVKKTPIHAIGGLHKLTDGVLTPILDATVKGLTANAAAYPKPPIDITTYGNAVSAYDAAIPAALDGSKTAKAQKNKLKSAAIKAYDQNAKYVEANCNDDMATFLLSGFQAKPSTKTLAPPTSDTIRKIEHGTNSGQLVVTLLKFKGATSYTLRYAVQPPAGGPAPVWTELVVTSVKTATTLSNLTPGTIYEFQVRAL